MIKFLKDSLSIFKKTPLTFLERREEYDGVYTFIFKRNENLDWTPGQHGIFLMKKLGMKNSIRPFSISSIPHEDKVMISTQFNGEPSKFKRALLSLKPSDVVFMRGPVGLLRAVENKPQVFIAAGMGITPFRSMIKNLEMTSKQSLDQIQLIYLNSKNQHIYKDDWSALTSRSSMVITHVSERQAMMDEVKKASEKYGNKAYYYVVGPNAMVSSVKETLKNQGIEKKKIKGETFFGY